MPIPAPIAANPAPIAATLPTTIFYVLIVIEKKIYKYY
jgi:hypothetical protein